MADRDTTDTLSRLERKARSGSRIAERVMWEWIASQASIDLRGQLPAMYEAWKDKGWTIATVLYKVRFNVWKREEWARDTSLDALEDFDAADRRNDTTDTLDALLDAADLSETEREIIEAYRAGMTQTDIADKMSVSQGYISQQLTVILAKIRENSGIE